MSESANTGLHYDYRPPVSQLLTMGDVRKISGWPDYLALGLTSEHVPDLIRMSLDDDLHWADSESQEVWAPIHAWRALGQLQAGSAVVPLISLLDRVDEFNDDWANEELPVVFGYIGQAAIEPLSRSLADARHGLWARVATASSFAEIGKRHPDLRDQCVAALTQQLEQYHKLDPSLNGFLISYLADLKAVESTSLMEQTFAADQVDISIQGDWEDTQIRLGLLTHRLTPKPRYHFWDRLLPSFLGGQPKPDEPPPVKDRHPADSEAKAKTKVRVKLETRRKANAKAKTKRKQQKKARKKKRKR